MKNIIDSALELIDEKGPVSIAEIKENLGDLLKEIPKKDVEACIYSDLLNDGRFIFVDGKWDLTINYTTKEIVKEQYKVLGSIDLVEDDIIVEDDDPLVIVPADPDEEIDYTAIDDLDDIEVFSQVDDDKN